MQCANGLIRDQLEEAKKESAKFERDVLRRDGIIAAIQKLLWGNEKEIKSLSGSKLDYVGVKAAEAIDFRGDNMTNFESLEKNSIDLYAATKSLYLQSRTKKIKNNSGSDEDAWGDLDK